LFERATGAVRLEFEEDLVTGGTAPGAIRDEAESLGGAVH
jgi:hypothetical protein